MFCKNILGGIFKIVVSKEVNEQGFTETKFCNFQLYASCIEIFALCMQFSNLNGGHKPRLRYTTSILTWTVTGPEQEVAFKTGYFLIS